MDEYKVEEINTKEVWEEFVLSHKVQSFLHSWNWGETNRIFGNRIFRLGYYDGSKLIGVCLLIEQKAKRGLHFLIPGGPIINWEDRNLREVFLKSIKDLAVKNGTWFVRVRPELLDNDKNKSMFKKLGFIPAPMHLHAENTWILDISKSDEELLSGMRKTTRYLVRKSLNAGLDFKESVNPKDTGILKSLQDETVARHNFVGFSEKLFKAQLESFGKDNQAALFSCSKGREVLASAIIIFFAEIAYYHHSGSVSSHREIPFSYFLQWRIIQEARRRGCKFYNFWGIAPNDNPRHRFAGVTLFKTGFGGERVDWMHAQDYPVSPFYYLTYVFESLRKIVRGL